MIKSITEIRQTFLNFFNNRGHKIVASSSLVPNDDPTLLFTNAGMNQFKDIFLGIEKRNYSRAATSQRCVRVGGKHNDLENVGYTERHNTFFEMLGNFSFGDYFKYEAIQYAWELLTCKNQFNIPKEKLLVSVYETDNESYEIWKKKIGIPHERIIRIGDNKGAPYSSDNFWQMGEEGPCGPCTEIFYDHGNCFSGKLPSRNEANYERYAEIWNIVFIQFNRQNDGSMELLKNPSVDTGMGLERISAVLQHVTSNYEIDLFRSLIKEIAKVIGVTDLKNRSLRVIADHIRSCAFLISDGVIPSNENRGYVLRRIIRRAIRHGSMLGVKNTFLHKLIDPLINVMGEVSQNLIYQQKWIEKVLQKEEEQFSRTVEKGLMLLESKLSTLKGNILDGKTVFHLYDTYGFPADLTEDICREKKIKIDQISFQAEMEKQRYRSKKSHIFKFQQKKIGYANHISKFQGYTHLKLDGTITALFTDEKKVDSLLLGEESVIFLDKTPFYAEAGGQAGDKGFLQGNHFLFSVTDTQKYGQAIAHIGKLISGRLKLGDRVLAKVDKNRRLQICLNHSATHLMHASLKKVIGKHIFQKGSLINEHTLRFDFSHFKAISHEEIYKIEDLVNEKIRCNLPIKSKIMNLEIAKSKGAIALFNEKYGEYVRVLNIGNFSVELCCGTHAPRTGDIGLFRIISESSIAAGIRRIEAVTGERAISDIHKKDNQLYDITKLLKHRSDNVSDKLRNLLSYMKRLEKDLKNIQNRTAMKESLNLFKQAINVKGVQLIVNQLVDIEPTILRIIVNYLKTQTNLAIIFLATTFHKKIAFIATVSKQLTYQITATELINLVIRQVGGKGGGCADIAQADGGKDISSLSTALASVKDLIRKRLQP